jgi:5-oxoprolinase (ATP-hydrolysing)
MNELIDVYNLDVVQAYMKYIQDNAELAVRDMLKRVGKNLIKKKKCNFITASDYLDDGSEIRLKLEIDIEKGEAVCDFT